MSTDRMQTVTPYLCCKGAREAIGFYERAFGAAERYRIPWKGDRLGHAEIAIGNTVVMLADEFPEMGVLSPATLGGPSCSLVVCVDDVDAAFARAVDAGATVERPLTDEPHGRGGWLRDPFGHRWHLMRPDPAFDPAAIGGTKGA
jgi:PhnB protein